MNTTNFFRLTLKALSILTLLVLVFAQAVPVFAQSAAPIEESITVQKKGESVTVKVLKGFNPNEYGGNDSSCTFTGSEPEMVHIGEVVGSPNESCLQVIEWSLKDGDQTIVAGTYALAPHEWFYIPLAVSGVNDQVRVVGTLYRMPKGWNAHMMAVYYAIDRDSRDGTHSYIGLSPTDPWVLAQIDSLSGRAPLATAVIDTALPPTSTPATLATPTAPVVEAPVTPGVSAPQPTATADPLVIPISGEVNKLNLMGWIIGALVLAVLFLAFRRPSAPVAPVAPKAAKPRRKTATKKKSTTE
ncbi:MAG: hypothetical protein WCG44_03885 [bacterium]